MLRSNSSPFPDLQTGLLCLYLFILLPGSFPTPQSFRLTPKTEWTVQSSHMSPCPPQGHACLLVSVDDLTVTSSLKSTASVRESSLLGTGVLWFTQRVTGCWPASMRVKCADTSSLPSYYCPHRCPPSECHMVAVVQYVAVPQWPFPLSSNFHFPFTCRTCFSCQ